MLITIPNVLSASEVAEMRAKLDAANWVDGKITAGYQAQKVKDNEQLPENSPLAVLESFTLSCVEKIILASNTFSVNAMFHCTLVPSGTRRLNVFTVCRGIPV